MPDLSPIELTTSSRTPDAAVIWLHGLGASGDDFVPVVPMLGLPESLAVRFLFPNAPPVPVTVNNGYVMPAWYDILDLDLERKIDQKQLLASAAAIQGLIEGEINRGIPPGRIVLAGFSQGGAVAYQAALTYPQRLAGLIALSTYLATGATLEGAAPRDLPIHIMHGTDDGVVPVALGKLAKSALERLGYRPRYSEYRMGHEVCPEEIEEIGRCLRQWLGES